jgi:anti-sigma factor RsiW
MTLGTNHLSEEQLALLATDVPEPALAAHLESCPECRARWEQYQALVRALRTLPRPALPRDFVFHPRSVARLHSAPWWWRYRFPIRVATLLAATFLVLLVTSAVVLVSPSTQPKERVATVARSPAAAVPDVESTPALTEAGGEAAPAVQALAASPTAPSEQTATAQTKASSSAPAAEEHETSVLLGAAGRFVLYGAIGILTIVTALGLVIGFVLPFVRRPQQPIHLR